MGVEIMVAQNTFFVWGQGHESYCTPLLCATISNSTNPINVIKKIKKSGKTPVNRVKSPGNGVNSPGNAVKTREIPGLLC